jgi:YVTN family beta-propeller protein
MQIHAGCARHGAALDFTDGAPVGSQPVDMVNTRDGNIIFVSDFSSAAITVLDAATWATRATIGVPSGPHGIVLSPPLPKERGGWGPLHTSHPTPSAAISLPSMLGAVGIPAAGVTTVGGM